MMDTQTTEEQAVLAAVEQLRAAMVGADATMLNALTNEDLSYGHSKGKVETKAEFVQNITSGGSVFVTLQLTCLYLKIFGNTAVLRHGFVADTNDGGKPGKVNLHILWVWQRDGSQWKLLARQAVRV